MEESEVSQKTKRAAPKARIIIEAELIAQFEAFKVQNLLNQ